MILPILFWLIHHWNTHTDVTAQMRDVIITIYIIKTLRWQFQMFKDGTCTCMYMAMIKRCDGIILLSMSDHICTIPQIKASYFVIYSCVFPGHLMHLSLTFYAYTTSKRYVDAGFCILWYLPRWLIRKINCRKSPHCYGNCICRSHVTNLTN